MSRTNAHFEKKEPFLEEILYKLRFQKVIKSIPPGSKVLDLGCGFNGKLLKKIEEKISLGVGIDISVNSQNKSSKIKLIAHDLNYPLPFSENEFDVVTSLANLEHLESPQKSLEEIYRVLKPGGILLLTTPSTYGKPVLEFLAFFGVVSKQEIQDHKNYFTKNILKRYCKEIGFSSCKHKYFQMGMNNFLTARK